MLDKVTLAFTTDASGDAVVTSEYVVHGFVHAVQYVDTDLDNTTGDLTLTGNVSGETIWTRSNSAADAFVYPRALVTETNNSTPAAGDVEYARVPVVQEKLKLTVAQGGDTKSGTMHVYLEH